MTTTAHTAEGHQIIAVLTAGTSTVFITRQAARKGGTLFVVNVAHAAKNYITWSQHSTEADARKSANRAWTRFSGRESMICA